MELDSLKKWLFLDRALKIVLALTMLVTTQGFYYYFYAQNLSLSYFDHPPAVAYWIALFDFIFPNKFLALLASKVSSYALCYFSLIKVSQTLFPEVKKEKAQLLIESTPFLSLLFVNITPDNLLLPFWALCALYYFKSIQVNTLKNWILAGIFLGSAMSSKYSAIFLLPGIFSYIILSKNITLFKNPRLYLSFITGLIVFAPVFIWNIQNDFASFRFQSSDRVVSFGIRNIGNFVLFILLQSFIFGIFNLKANITPIKEKTLFYLKNKALPRNEVLLLLCFSLPLIAFFTLTSFFAWIKINWILPALLPLVVLSVLNFNSRHVLRSLKLSVFIHFCALIQIHFYPFSIKSDDSYYGWKQINTKVQEIRSNLDPEAFLFSRDEYKTTAALMFYSEKKAYGRNIVGENALHFDYIGDNISALKGQNAFYIDSDKKMKNLGKRGKVSFSVKKVFSKTEELDPILIYKGNKVVRKFYVYHCKNYLGPTNSL